ncbi:stage V sporulation protein E|uniref:Probable peptidoglycan glycosyltransferase FtsW n=1 Tax=Dendrosporobacter quercicolus TaxID=146817 RepID=A0A1G9MD86_9FIRM|nr:stage V sporulation protein E [Dendrosporobacter quercicolus]NSL47002.1 stage V sporulation protein E [Dendrosporobacter quercicolus DSM 1736]SDL72169.1 cell division-specific peptidoglycan biosynthesis regulator FtsW [Dendrosporobacter quercicolus]
MAARPKSPDFIIFFAVIALLGIGVIMVYSSSAVSAYVNFNDSYYFLKRQMIWASLGLLCMIFTMNLDYHVWRKLAKPMMLVTLVLLVLVLVPGLGKVVNGARRWLGFGSLYLQPSEIAKLSMVLFTAGSLAKHQEKIGSFIKGVVPQLLMLLVVFGLILKEPDLGTALSIGGTVFVLLFVAGAKLKHLGSLGAAGVAGIIAAVLFEPYRMKRLLAFSDPWADPLDTGYHIIQSLYAIGSGGLFGVGLGRSREKFLYLPEPHTDFIFAILGEELGLIGTLTVIVLFFLFAWRGLKVAISAPDIYGSILATGLTTMIMVQALMNIAVVTASMPVTGIPLPFLSFGGSSLIFTLAGVGILLNISRYVSLK